MSKRPGVSLSEIEASPILVWGIAGLVFALGLTLLLEGFRIVDGRAASLEGLRSQAAAIAEAGDLEAWPERAEAAQAASASWTGRVARGATVGVLRASLQQSLEETLSGFEIRRPNVIVGDALVDIDGVQTLRFQINGLGNSLQVLSVASRLATSRQRFVIEEASLSFLDDQVAPFQISGVAPVAIQPQGSGAPR